MAELTIKPPVPRIRLFTLPDNHLANYQPYASLNRRIAPPHGLTGNQYGWSSGHLTEYVTPTLELSIGPSMFEDFSIKKVTNGVSRWEATIKLDADFDNNKDNIDIIEAAIKKGAFALCYFAKSDEDTASLDEIMGWGATNRVSSTGAFTSEPAAWTRRGMVGPVKTKINKEQNKTIGLTIIGQSSIQWLADVKHLKYGDGENENWKPAEGATGAGGTARAFKFLAMASSLFRENCEFDPDPSNDNDTERRPTQIGRMLMYPRITQAAWNRIKDDPNPRDLYLKPGPGAMVLKSLMDLCAQADCFIYDAGIDVVIDTATQSGMTLGTDILATTDAEYGRPKRNQFYVHHKDTVNDFPYVLNITRSFLQEQGSISGINMSAIGTQEDWGVISGKAIPSRAPHATVDPDRDDTTDDDTEDDNEAKPVPDIGKPAKTAIMQEQAFEEATKDIISQKGSAVIQTEAGDLIGDTIKLGLNYNLDLFGLGENKPGYLANQLLYEWAAETQGDTDTYAYTPGFSPIANIIPGAGFKPAHTPEIVQQATDLDRRVTRLEEVELDRSTAIEITAAATPDEPDMPDIPEGGTTEPTGGVSYDILPNLNSSNFIVVHGDILFYHLSGQTSIGAYNVSTRSNAPSIPLPGVSSHQIVGGYLSATNTLAIVLKITLSRSITYRTIYKTLPAVSGSMQDNFRFTTNNSRLLNNVPSQVLLATDRSLILYNTRDNINFDFFSFNPGDYTIPSMPYTPLYQKRLIPSKANVSYGTRRSDGINLYYTIYDPSYRSISPSNYTFAPLIGRTPLVGSGQNDTFIEWTDVVPHLPDGWQRANIHNMFPAASILWLLIYSDKGPSTQAVYTLLGFSQTSPTGQILEWSPNNYNIASNRYELTYDKNTSGAAEHRVSKFPISLRSRQVPDLGAGGTTSLSYAETGRVDPVGGLLDNNTNFGIADLSDIPLGTYQGILTGTASALGNLSAVTEHRNTRISIINSSSGTHSKAAPPVVSPIEQKATAYAGDTGAQEIARFLVSVPGVSNPRVVAEISDGDTALWSVDAVAASIDGSTGLYVRLYQTWPTARTNLEDSYRVKVDFHHEQIGKTNSDDTQAQVDITINTGTSTPPTTRYFTPRVNTSWSVASSGTVTNGTTEVATLDGAFTAAQGFSITSVQVRAKTASRSLVSVTTTQTSSINNFTMRFLAVGKASIELRGWDGRNWSPWRTITRNIVAAAGSDNNAGMWIKRSGETNAVPMDANYSFNVPEGQAKTRLFANDELYFSCAQASNRTLEIDLEFYGAAATGSIVRETDGVHAFTTAAGSLTGIRFKLFSVGTTLDYETTRSVRTRVAGTGSRYTSGGTTWEEAEDQFFITLNITNVNEPPQMNFNWINQYLSSDGKLHLRANTVTPLSTAGSVRDDGDNNALITIRTAVSPSTSNLSARWARGTGTALGDGTLTLTAGAQQTAETTLQLTAYDGNSNSATQNVTVVIDASDKITPTASISATDTGISIAENTAVGTTIGNNLTAYFNSVNLQAVFGRATLEVSGDGAAYVNAEFVGTPGDGNTASRIRTTYEIKRTIKKSPDFEVYGAVGKTVTITIRSQGSHNTSAVSASYSFVLTVTDVTELVRRNSVNAPDHTFVIDLALAQGGTLPHWDVDPSAYFQDDDPDDSRPVTYTHNEVFVGAGDTGIFTIQDVTVAGKDYVRFTPRSALINGSPQSRDYEIHANQQGGVQSTPARGTITVNPYAPRPLRSHYPSPAIFIREYINSDETSTDFEIASHYTNLDNRPVRFGFNTDFDQTDSDSVAQYTFVTQANGTIIARATRQATYTPSTETFFTTQIIYVGTTDPATPSVIPIYYGLTVTRPSS